jgi:hypothetical protein
MIVFTSAFETAEAATDTPLTHARIGYQNWLRDLTITAVEASSETADGPRDQPLNPDTHSFWEPESLPATYTITLGATRAVDYVGLLGRIGSVGASVLVETSDGTLINSPAEEEWTTFAESASPDDDAPLFFLDASRDITRIRLTFTGSTMPRLAVVYAGEVLKMERMIYGGHAPGRLSRVTVLNGAMSRGGQFLGQDFRRHGFETSASFRHLTAAWVRSDFDLFVRDARKYPYFFGWRPADFEEEVEYAWTPEDIRVSNMGVRDFMQVSWPIVGYGFE